jgi:hypothetical protein
MKNNYSAYSGEHYDQYLNFKKGFEEALKNKDKDHKIYLFRKILTNIEDHYDIGICIKSHLA